jgi:poly-gamma-glutamate capsule biosynthesis protein CapA/YwtB (metallophosphatase superfamily)
MRRCAVAVACIAIVAIGSQVLSACGDKFLLVGRGVRFDRAYAAVHPASILIVLPPKSVKSAAVRDERLLTALKMAGHRVDTVQRPANLTEALGRSRHDIVLAERADASAVRSAATDGAGKPSIVGVLEDPSSAALTAARRDLEYVLKTPDSLAHILNLLDDVMQARQH